MKSGKVMAYGTRNKVCRLCESGRSVENHDCRKNWNGSAKAMEPDIAVEIITQNSDLVKENVVVDTLIGDDDSSTVAAVRREAKHPLSKWSDLNHATRNLSKALWCAKVNKNVIEYIKHCFGCAIKKNKGNVEATKAALASIVPHAFDEHDSCGEWCRFKDDPVNFKHNGLSKGEGLKGQDLKDLLTSVMMKFIVNAEKLAPCGSSQSNESLNAIIASKTPKSHHYGSSESYDFRVASGVCQKNIGTSYINHVYPKLHLSPGQTSKRFREKKDLMREYRALHAKKPEFKRKRLLLKKKRSQFTITTDRKEGITYLSGCGIDSINVTDAPVQCPEGPIVFVDIETTGLSLKNAEICQIAAKWEDKEFCNYIIPTKGIPQKVYEITHLKIICGELFYKEEKVETVQKHDALVNFIQFLKSTGPDVIVAHNGLRFDFSFILRDIVDCDLLESFRSTVFGFADSLSIIKKVLPERKKQKLKFNLETLIADLLGNFLFTNAHNALGDIQALQQLLNHIKVPKKVIFDNTVSVVAFARSKQKCNEIFKNSEILSFMKTSVSRHMIKRIAMSGISLSTLQEAFLKSSDKGVELLLGEDVGGRPRVTKNKKILSNIILEIKKSLL